MKNGRFTKEEREYLEALEAVERAHPTFIVYSREFKRSAVERWHAGVSQGRIFADAGMPASLIGQKRIDQAMYHWRQEEARDALGANEAPATANARNVESLKRQKREAVARQRGIRERRVAEMEDRLAKQKRRAKTREEKLIASQAAEIAALKAQVRALKAVGTLARRTQRAPYSTSKSERFELISQLRNGDPAFDVKAACAALEVSRSGYYEWLKAAPKREERERADLAARDQISEALSYRGFRKGSREVRDCMQRRQGITMNRKKILRISRKYGLAPRPRRKHPYHPIGTDGLPKVADNVVNRDFRRGGPLKVISTDITYLPSRDGFSYLSGVIDCETNVVLAHVTSTSMEEKFVLDTYDQLRGMDLPDDIWACSDQGVHYTARADDFIDYYNSERDQARLGWLTPSEYARKLTV